MPALRRANNSSRSVTSSTVTEQQQLAEIAGTFDAAKSVQLAMQSFDLIVGHRRGASATAMKSVKTKGASQERASAAQPEGRI